MGPRINLQTDDGVLDAYTFQPEGQGSWPGVIFFMDGLGIRPALHAMAKRVATDGYFVIMPNLYYRSGPQPAIDVAEVFKGGPARDGLMKLVQSINGPLIMRDIAACLDFLDTQPAVRGKKVGVHGYCMGGRYALMAAGTYPDRVAASGSFHAGGLANDQPDSPHLLAPNIRAKVYIAVAGIDPFFPEAERERIETALRNADVDFRLEVYPDVQHGFAVDDVPVYNRVASERHWKELERLYRATLP